MKCTWIFHELSTAMSEDPSDPIVILFDFYHREDSRFDLRLWDLSELLRVLDSGGRMGSLETIEIPLPRAAFLLLSLTRALRMLGVLN